MRIVNDNILPHFTSIPLEHEDYLRALDVVGGGGFAGPKIYDALLLQCAARCKVKRIYTFNLLDFRKLAGPGQQPLIHAPGSSGEARAHKTLSALNNADRVVNDFLLL